jgi:hypothetical protein
MPDARWVEHRTPNQSGPATDRKVERRAQSRTPPEVVGQREAPPDALRHGVWVALSCEQMGIPAACGTAGAAVLVTHLEAPPPLPGIQWSTATDRYRGSSGAPPEHHRLSCGMTEKRNTVLLRVRALPHEAEALRAEAKRRGIPLSHLVLELAADAGLVEHRGDPVRSTTGAPPEHRPAVSARLDALEARVLALEGKPTRTAPRTAAARPGVAEGPTLKRAPTTGRRQYAQDDHRRPVERLELPDGFPATGAELAAWRNGHGLRRAAFADAVNRSRESLRQQEGKGDLPLSAGLALDLVAAVEAGDLPAPG